MKIKDIFSISALVLSAIIILVLFTGYGNKKVHPDLNAMMIKKFLEKNNKGDFSQKEFRKYTFFFEQDMKLKGLGVIKEGLFSPNDLAAAGVVGDAGAVIDYNTPLNIYCEEGTAEMTPQGWIVHGGLAADVPEVPASLRHFYDPTRNVGDRYLTDIANSKLMGSLQKYALTNPHTDGIEWAIGQPGDKSNDAQSHQFTWERGKMWMQMALQEAKDDKRNEFMARAWRALGETLHMIADNGCPPHVRNDAHPSPIWRNNSWLGDPDPYEELVDIIRRDDPETFVNFASGLPDNDLKNKIKDMKKVRDLAHALAEFTNKNFVTNQTISGVDKYGNKHKQIIHPENEYTSPLLQQMTYNQDDYSYISPSGTKQCVDHYYFSKLPLFCSPYVDVECVKSQASQLFPNITEVGANVIGLFIPKLKVEIKSLNGNLVKGEIIHRKDPEYQDEIKYTGNVTLQLKNNKYRILQEIKVQAHNGKFETSGLSIGSEGGILCAYIDFGGIRVQSDDFPVAQKAKEPEPVKVVSGGAYINRVLIYVEGSFDNTLTCGGYTNDPRTWIDLESHNIPISQVPGKFKGSKRYGIYLVEVSGTFTEDELLEFKYKGTGTLGCREQEWDIELRNIPRINKETDAPNQATFQLRPYDNIDWKSNKVNMADHVPRMVLKEVSIEDKSRTRTLIETSWGRIVMGSTINISPKNQQSALEVSFSW